MNEHDIADFRHDLEGRRRRPTISSGLIALVLGVIAVAAIALTVLPTIITHPSFVSKVRITNASDYDIQVSVGHAAGSAWVSLGAAGQQCTTTFEQVADQGASWDLRFSAQGVDGGTMTVTRASLEASGWTVTIPTEVAQGFSDKGVVLPPHRDCGSLPAP